MWNMVSDRDFSNYHLMEEMRQLHTDRDTGMVQMLENIDIECTQACWLMASYYL